MAANNTEERTDPRQAVIENIAKMAYDVLPLMRSRLLGVEQQAEQSKLPLSHLQILALLNKSGSLSITAISKRFGIAKPNITPIIDRLLAEGYVDRSRDTQDRRIVNIVLCDAGRQRIEEVHRAQAARISQDTARTLSAADLASLHAALMQVESLLNRA